MSEIRSDLVAVVYDGSAHGSWHRRVDLDRINEQRALEHERREQAYPSMAMLPPLPWTPESFLEETVRGSGPPGEWALPSENWLPLKPLESGVIGISVVSCRYVVGFYIGQGAP